MHEHSLMNDLVRKILDVARRQNARKVTRVKVAVGALSHFSRPHFMEHFVQAAEGTPAEGARLDIDMLEGTAHPHAREVLLESVEVEE